MMTKRASNNIHTKKRAKERIGVDLTTLDLKKLSTSVQENRSDVEFIKKLSNNKSAWKVTIKGTAAKLIYDRKRKNFVTCLDEKQKV